MTVVRWTGVEVRALREALRMGVRDFASHTGLSVSALADLEAKGPEAKPRHATQHILDTVLERARDEARTRFESLRATATRHRRGLAPLPTSPGPRLGATDLRAGSTATWALYLYDGQPPHPQPEGETLTMVVPPGRSFTGASIDVKAYPAADDGQILAAVPNTFMDDQFVRRSRRGVLVGVTGQADGPALFGLDNRRVRRHLAAVAEGAHIPIPKAYRIDDLTTGLLWAVANLDEALLGDDALLSACKPWVAGYEGLDRSTASREAAEGLSAVSQMWLGSDFCAKHILRHCRQLVELPVFWTREQRGEDASTWLLFDHKYDYLRQLTSRYGGNALSRTFCIPVATVADSARPERILLMLAVALMESFGIRVNLCLDPAYASLEGFVLDQTHQHAIVANWVGAESIWYVDLTTDRPTLRGYADAVGYGQNHSVTNAADPADRLRTFAEFLELDWRWLAGRCGEFAAHGAGGLIEPRSRLLSVAGIDRACEYLGRLVRDDR